MSLGNAAAFLLVAVLTGAAFVFRRCFWAGLILLALLSGMGLLL